MHGFQEFIIRWATEARRLIARARLYAKSKHEVAEYAEYIAVVALIAVALGVGLRLLHPFAADALDNVVNTISDSL